MQAYTCSIMYCIFGELISRVLLVSFTNDQKCCVLRCYNLYLEPLARLSMMRSYSSG